MIQRPAGATMPALQHLANIGASRSLWVARAVAFIQTHDLSKEILAWAETALSGSPAFHFLCPREQVTLVARYAYMLQKHQVNPTTRRVIFQVDQSIDYCPTGVDVAPCICPNGKYWDSVLMRPLSAHEHAALQGIGAAEREFFHLGDIGCSRWKDLAGNAFSGNVCVAVLLGALSAWRT